MKRNPLTTVVTTVNKMEKIQILKLETVNSKGKPEHQLLKS